MGKEGLEIRSDILTKVTSEEAAEVTPHLSRIYLRLVNAPAQYWERENVLRFTGNVEGGRTVSTAWAQLVARVQVPPDVARKALEWLHDQGIIIFSASQNGREIILTFEGISNPGRGR